MKIEKLVENRIEKHLDLVEEISAESSEVLNTTEETLPTVITVSYTHLRAHET